jgi:hypothetical protein
MRRILVRIAKMVHYLPHDSNLSVYGAAIEAGSLEGLLVAIIFQGSIYLFYGIVELPFIRRVYLQS